MTPLTPVPHETTDETTEPMTPDTAPSQEVQLPKVGTPAGRLPGADESPSGKQTQGEVTSQWWQEQAQPAPAPQPTSDTSDGALRTPAWVSSANQEMSRIRRLPVVGRLPWRWQYAIAIVLALVACIILAVLLSITGRQSDEALLQSVAGLQLNQAVQSMAPLRHIDSTRPVDAAAYASALNQGHAALNGLETSGLVAQQPLIADLNAQWKALETAIQKASERAASVQSLTAAAQDLYTQLGDVLPRMQASAQQVSPMPADLAAVMASLADWRDMAGQWVGVGTPLPERALQERQRIEQLLRAFAASPSAQSLSPQTDAWRSLAAVWSRLQGRMDALLEQRQVMNDAHAGVGQFGDRLDNVSKTLGAFEAAGLAAQSSQATLRRSVWVVLGLLIFSLFVLGLVVWRHVKVQALELRDANEQIEFGIQSLGQDLKEVAAGNLLRPARPVGTPVDPVAESINHALDRLRRSMGKIKQTVEDTANASSTASEATVSLVDETRERAAGLDAIGGQIVTLAKDVRDGARQAIAAAERATEVQTRANEGSRAVEEGRSRARNIRSRLEDGVSRARRLVVGASELSSMAERVLNLAEEAHLLAVQASVYASKAGERGQPFQRVADGLQALSERLDSEGQKLGAQSGQFHGDTDSLSENLSSALTDTDDSARLNDVAQEAMLDVAERMGELHRLVNELKTRASAQGSSADNLEVATNQEMARGSEARRLATVAANAVMTLVTAVREQGEAMQKLRV